MLRTCPTLRPIRATSVTTTAAMPPRPTRAISEVKSGRCIGSVVPETARSENVSARFKPAAVHQVSQRSSCFVTGAPDALLR